MDEIRQAAERLGGIDITVIPIAAKHGDNVVHRSERTPWYDGPTLLEYLESIELVGATPGGREFAIAGAMGIPADPGTAQTLHRPTLLRDTESR